MSVPRAGQVAAAGAAAGHPPGGRAPSRSRWKVIVLLLAITGVLAGGAWALLDSRLLAVRAVHVVGSGPLVSRAEVRAAARIQRGLPLIRLDGAAVARRVEKIRQVQSARVSRDWPDAVTITVRQRTPVFAVPAPGGGYGLVDAFGVTVTTAARRPPGMPLLSAGPAGTALRRSPAVRAAAAVLRELPQTIRRRVRAVAAPGPEEVSLRLAGGVTVVWGGPQRAAEKSRELAVLMRTHARRYDVSGPGVAVTQG